MTTFKFDLGNSIRGPIGYVANIRANSREEAQYILQEKIVGFQNGLEVCVGDGPIDYITVYFNPNAISLKHCWFVEE